MRVCITGGTGSLGRALIPAFLARTDVERVVVLSRDEVKQGHLDIDFPDPRLRCFLGDVRDRERCILAFRDCDTAIHAAALKRVTHSVYSPDEMIKTNVLGTINVIMAALQARVARVLVVSSDKAVEATNLYGKTKAIAEDFAVQSNSYTYPQGTRVSVVRYGNVMGSRGSVVEVWREQKARHQPLTLTSSQMTRFLISLSQAVDLIQTVLGCMEGGDIFVPWLPAARVEDILEALHGATYPVQVTGLRPGGEKLHESLLSSEETHRVHLLTPYLGQIIPTFHPWRAAWDGSGTVLPLTSASPVLAPEAVTQWLLDAGPL